MRCALFGFVHQDLEAVLFLAVKCHVIRIIAWWDHVWMNECHPVELHLESYSNYTKCIDFGNKTIKSNVHKWKINFCIQSLLDTGGKWFHRPTLEIIATIIKLLCSFVIFRQQLSHPFSLYMRRIIMTRNKMLLLHLHLKVSLSFEHCTLAK